MPWGFKVASNRGHPSVHFGKHFAAGLVQKEDGLLARARHAPKRGTEDCLLKREAHHHANVVTPDGGASDVDPGPGADVLWEHRGRLQPVHDKPAGELLRELPAANGARALQLQPRVNAAAVETVTTGELYAAVLRTARASTFGGIFVTRVHANHATHGRGFASIR
ncbi:hypothetical protein PI124_g4355 [Phytophthora idaei]|nr:hypothetical protein PI124_g4355 [Phytophthora idaei]